MRAVLGCLLLPFAAACGEGPIALTPSAQLSLEPPELDLGPVPAGVDSEAALLLRLEGGRALRILAVEGASDGLQLFDEAEGFTLPGRRLEPREALPLRLRLRPTGSGVIEQSLRIVGDTSEALLSVRAVAVEVEPEDLSFSPARIDFGETFVGQRPEQSLLVFNDALVPAHLRQVPSDALWAAPAELAIPARSSAELTVSWAPATDGSAPALQWRVNERADANLPVEGAAVTPGTLVCEGGLAMGAAARGEVRTATAACRADGPIEVRTVGLRGSPAFELLGETIVERGLQLELRFAPTGLAGRQTGAVQVETVEGQRAEIALEGQTVGPTASVLRAALSWTEPGADLDLHFTRGEAVPFEGGEDCHFQDKNPSWGDPEDWVDDPFLDRDALEGPGLEVVHLEAPVESRYAVWVHAFGFEGSAWPQTSAVLSLDVDGRSFEATTGFGACGRMWLAGTLTRANAFWSWTPAQQILDYRGFADERCRP